MTGLSPPNSRIVRIRYFPRRAFTLLELVLAIALSVVLLGLLATSINLHLIRVDASRQSVERAQLVRGLFRILAEDLRQAAVGYVQDTAEATKLAEASAAFDVDQVDVAQAGAAGGAGTTGSTGTTTQQSQEAPTRPPLGMAGDSASFSVYVERERPSGFSPEAGIVASTTSAPGGVTLVRYAIATGEVTDTQGRVLRGLVRQEVGRDVYLLQSDQGGDPFAYGSTWNVGPEVVGMQIDYTDGSNTFQDWGTSEDQSPLPAAVDVTLTLRTDSLARIESGAPADPKDLATHRFTIALPASFDPGDDSSEEEESDSASSGGVSGSSTGGGGGGAL